MKTGIIENVGRHGYFNLTAITDKGSPISTQLWVKDGNPHAAAARLLEWHADGERDKGKQHAWNSVIEFAFIHSTATGETYRYDLNNHADMGSLRAMAGQSISPAS